MSCPYCGTNIHTVTCSKCGAEICDYCGSEIDYDNEEKKNAEVQEEDNPTDEL